ncbi:unnamed protein product, partial [Notodromas monacha]
MNADALQGRSVSFHGKTLSWYRPVTLAEILELKEKFPEAKIIGGNTEVGKYNFSWRPFQQRLEVRQKGNEYPVLISSEAIKELHVLQVVVLDDGSRAVRIGAAATLSKLEDYLRTIVAQNKEYETSTFKTILEMLEWFAGKQIRNVARFDDIRMSGQRHGFLGVYKLAADSNGKLLGLDLNLFSNAGYSQDLSPFVMEKSMLDCTNAYEIPVVRVRGRVCRTNLPSNTAFRGFGAMQSMMICEQFMSHMADKLGIHQTTFREMNLKAEGCKLFYGQVLTNVTLERCWKEVLENSQFNERFSACEKFNRENKWRKRAISIIPETYGISFTASFMNQGGALVHIYKDGSVLVTHGGVEMGQGLHTKMIQVASRALKIPPKYIHTSEVGTDKVPNTTSTAASFSTDLNGPAVQQACETILNRMEPYIRENPKGNWEGWVKAAYMDCVSLSSTGYYCMDGGCLINGKRASLSPKVLGLFELKDPEKKGPSNVYHSFGAAVSEVEVDCLTGDHKVLRTDIVFDVGDSINPAVDVGQIEGGFIQGYGYWMLEDLEFGPEGQIRTLGPSTYKIPSSRDIPEVFNVALLKGAPNPHAIYSSKVAVGEPPLFLSASIFFAVREAIAEYRKQNGITAHFQLDSPATSERIRMLCQDTFTEKVEKTQPTADPKAK